MAVNLDEEMGRNALMDKGLGKYNWLLHLPKVALDELIGLVKNPGQKSPEVARKIQETVAGSSAPARYRKATDQNIALVMRQ